MDRCILKMKCNSMSESSESNVGAKRLLSTIYGNYGLPQAKATFVPQDSVSDTETPVDPFLQSMSMIQIRI